MLSSWIVLTADDMDDGGWHLDKKVPITLITALIGQLCVGIWFFSEHNQRLENLEDRNKALERRLASIPERMAKMEATMGDIRDIMLSIMRNRVSEEGYEEYEPEGYGLFKNP